MILLGLTCHLVIEMVDQSLALLAGKSEANGRMHVTLCDYIMPWDSLSNTQKKGLTQRYQMGCECKVRRWRNAVYARFNSLRPTR